MKYSTSTNFIGLFVNSTARTAIETPKIGFSILLDFRSVAPSCTSLLMTTGGIENGLNNCIPHIFYIYDRLVALSLPETQSDHQLSFGGAIRKHNIARQYFLH